MWVRLTFVKIQPDKIDEFKRIYLDEIVPVVKEKKGNVGIYLFESVEEIGQFISVASWDSKDDAQAYEDSGLYDSNKDKARHLAVEPPVLKQYELVT